MHFDMLCVPWVYEHTNRKEVKKASLTGDHATPLTQTQKQLFTVIKYG